MNSATASHLRESIATFEGELEWAEKQLAEATEARQRAHRIEDEWQIEVNSLRKLIEVRRSRLNPEQSQDANGQPSQENKEGAPEVNRVDWTFDLVVASGQAGVLPPEVHQAAKNAGISMHKNYPYVALGKLVERRKVEKRADGRYYTAEW